MKPEIVEYWLEVIGLMLLVLNLVMNSVPLEMTGLLVLIASVILDKPR